MKAFASLFMSLVISAAMLTGCGCTNRNGAVTTSRVSVCASCVSVCVSDLCPFCPIVEKTPVNRMQI